MRTIVVISSAIFASYVTAARAEPVTTCGQTVVRGELTADLDCSSYNDGPALVVERSLLLNGFTLTGNAALPALPQGAPDYAAIISCPSNCTITGPGTITSGPSGIVGDRNVTLTDVTLLDTSIALSPSSPAYGAVRGQRKVTIQSCIISNHQVGVTASRLRVFDSTISDIDDYATFATNTADVRNSTVTQAVWGVRGDRNLRLENSTVTNHIQVGVWHGLFNFLIGPAKITGCTISGNGLEGVGGNGRVMIRDSQITGNGEAGVSHTYAQVTDSDVSGNCTAPAGECADIYSCSPPSVQSTTCDTSLCRTYPCNHCTAGASWGVCSLD